MFAKLDFLDFVIIAVIVSLLSAGSAASGYFRRSDRARLGRLERKVDAVMKHLGVVYVDPAGPEGLSEEVRRLADNPATKLEAIKLHREQTGLGLREAKDAVEAYTNRG